MRAYLSLAGLLFLVSPIKASLIQFTFTGQVTNVYDPNNLLDGIVANGNDITGLFSYDTSAAPIPNSAIETNYGFSSGPSTLLINITTSAGIQTFAIDYSNDFDGLPPYDMLIVHDPGVDDSITASAFSSAATWPSLFPSLGLVDQMEVGLLSAPPYSLLQNLSLPTSIDFAQSQDAYRSDAIGDSSLSSEGSGQQWDVYFKLTSLTEVPEPGSAVFAAVGLAILWWIHKKASNGARHRH